ncbi:RNA 2',3'-cyclic phosphodiesterase [Nocardioides aurantiacus]|nr:RNA 2',3'-cyclic phosphodiesterase [Nocardioides aurantiacus]
MFVAVLPPPEVLEHLEEFLAPRQEARVEGRPWRWTPVAQWHVTLAFMEDVPDRALDTLVERLAVAASRRRPVQARLAGGGAFPDPSRAKLLFAGIETDPVELERMATGARHAAAGAGVEVDGQRFRPHLTVARIARAVEATRWLRVLDTYAGPTWTVEEVVLVASHLGEGPGGRARHEVVGTCPLGAREGQSRPRP